MVNKKTNIVGLAMWIAVHVPQQGHSVTIGQNTKKIFFLCWVLWTGKADKTILTVNHRRAIVGSDLTNNLCPNVEDINSSWYLEINSCIFLSNDWYSKSMFLIIKLNLFRQFVIFSNTPSISRKSLCTHSFFWHQKIFQYCGKTCFQFRWYRIFL